MDRREAMKAVSALLAAGATKIEADAIDPEMDLVVVTIPKLTRMQKGGKHGYSGLKKLFSRHGIECVIVTEGIEFSVIRKSDAQQ